MRLAEWVGMNRLGAGLALFVLTSCSGAPQDLHGAESPDGLPQAAAQQAPDDSPVKHVGATELVVHANGRSFVMLPNEVAEGTAVGDAMLLEEANEVATVTRHVDATKLPAEVAALRSQKITVVADSGTRCIARVSDVVLLARVSPDWPLLMRRLGKSDDPTVPAPAPIGDAAFAEEAFQLGQAGARLALALDLSRESCTGAHFAVMSGDPESARPLPANEAATETAIVTFRALPESLKHGDDYTEHLSYRNKEEDRANGFVPAPTWDTYQGLSPTVHRFVVGDETLLFVTAGVEEGCGGFNAAMSALFRQTEEGPVLIRTWDGLTHEPHAIVSTPKGYDVIFEDIKASTYEEDLTNTEPQYFGCRC
jgi:hypothetical protein